jgi:hypothetical protein
VTREAALGLLNEAAGAQIGERIVGRHRRQPRDATLPDRHDHLAALGGAADVPAG